MSAHKPRVLVIDDEPQIHRFLGPALEASGYEHVRADTAAAGLHALARKASSKIATARVQPAEAPRILWGKQLMKKPSAGSASSGGSFSRWQ